MDEARDLEKDIRSVEILIPGTNFWDGDPMENSRREPQTGVVKEGSRIEVAKLKENKQFSAGSIRSFSSDNQDLLLDNGSLDAGTIAVFKGQKIWWRQ